MVNVSEELKEAFLSHTEKHILLTFSDNTTLDEWDFQLESLEIEQAICDENLLTFGKCSSSCFKGTINNDSKSRKGLEFDVTLSTMGIGDTEYTFNLGHYKVYEDNVSDDRNTREIVAYDSLYEVLKTDYKDWYFNLHLDTTPMTLKQFRDSFFSHIGITQKSTTLINDSFIIVKTINAKSLTGQDILQAICELNACFGNIDYDGNFRYVTFMQEFGIYPRDDLYPSDDLYPDDPNVSLSVTNTDFLLGTFVYKDYVCQKIDSVSIKEDSDDDGIFVGSGTNTYSIEGNFLTFGTNNTQRTTIAYNFLEFVKEFFYIPTKIQMWGMPWLEVGDLIQVIGKTNAIVFPILHRTLKGITALKDSFEAKGSQTYEKAKNSMLSQFEKYKSQTMKVERNLDGFYQEFTQFEGDVNGEFESQSSRITQTSAAITAEVNRASTAEGNLSSRITQNAEQIELRVEKNGVISAINQSAESITINANKINLTGYVTATDLRTSGSTVINGSNITTGTINAININGCTITGSTYNTTPTPSGTSACFLAMHDTSIDFYKRNGGVDTCFGQIVADMSWSLTPSLADGIIHITGAHTMVSTSLLCMRGIEVMAETSAGSYDNPYIDFRWGTDALTVDYKSRIQVAGGTEDWRFHFVSRATGQEDYTSIVVSQVHTTSSRVVKENIVDITDDDAKKVLDVKPVEFDYKKSKKHSQGMIAEEVYPIFPNLVDIPKDWDEDSYTEDMMDVPTLNYTGFIPYMIKMIQIQQNEINELKERL